MNPTIAKEIRNTATTTDRLVEIIKQHRQDAVILDVMSRRSEVPEEVAEAIIETKQAGAIFTLLLLHQLSSQNISRIWHLNPDAGIRAKIATQAKCPAHILAQLAFDRDRGVAEAFQKGPASVPMKRASEVYQELETVQNLHPGALENTPEIVKLAAKNVGGVTALARHCSVSNQCIHNWIKGTRTPRANLMSALVSLVCER